MKAFVPIIIVIIVLFIFGFVFLRKDKSYLDNNRPNSDTLQKEIKENDKVIDVKNVSFDEVSQAIKQFCNSYNQTDYVVLPRLYKLNDQEFIITFPYDISFDYFCYFINYLKYPNDIKYKPDITAWATIRKSDTWAISDTIDKNVMLFIPDSDKEYDNVYLSTSDNLSFKMGFAVKEQNQRLEKIIKEYSRPIDMKEEIRNMEYISYK